MNKLTLDPNKKLYAVCWPQTAREIYSEKGIENAETRDIWTLSQNLDDCEWETDAGTGGYGLTKADAELIAERWNAGLKQEESSDE